MKFRKIGTAILILALALSIEFLREETFSRGFGYFRNSGFPSKVLFETQKLYAYPVPGFYQVTVNAQGNGSGSIGGNLSGVAISAAWNGSTLVGNTTATVPEGSGPYSISAVAQPGSQASWSGCDGVSGDGTALAHCALNPLTANRTISSSFSLLAANNKNHLPLILAQYQTFNYSCNLTMDNTSIPGGGKSKLTVYVKDEQGAFVTDRVTAITLATSLGGTFNPLSIF